MLGVQSDLRHQSLLMEQPETARGCDTNARPISNEQFLLVPQMRPPSSEMDGLHSESRVFRYRLRRSY